MSETREFKGNGAAQASGTANSGVLQLNGLRYKMPAPLSTTLLRTHKRQFAHNSSYSPGQTMTWDLNTSGQIDPESSYLKLDVTSTINAGWGEYGSCMNLFNEIFN